MGRNRYSAEYMSYGDYNNVKISYDDWINLPDEHIEYLNQLSDMLHEGYKIKKGFTHLQVIRYLALMKGKVKVRLKKAS